jgi:predicted PurR-regulated permease PerM
MNRRAPELARPLNRLRIELSPRTFLWFFGLLGGLWLLNRLMAVVLVLLAALIIAGTIGTAVQWLEERRLRRSLAIAVVFSGVFAVTVLFITMTIPALVAQASSLLAQEPVLRIRLAAKLAGSPLTSPLAELLSKVHSGDLVRVAAASAISVSARIIAIFGYILSSVFLALYILIDRDRLRGGLYLVVPRTHHVRLSRIMLSLETIVGGYIRGQAITSLFMAAFTFILLRSCGVASALAIAVFAGVADVLPYSGALLSVGAATLAAVYRGPACTLVVFLLMLAYEEFESRVIVPRVYGQALRLPSSVIFFSLLAGVVLAGVAGALFALPAAAALLMILEELRVELPGYQEQPGDIEIRERDVRGEAEYERRAEGMPAEQAAAIAVEISTDRQNEERDPLV